MELLSKLLLVHIYNACCAKHVHKIDVVRLVHFRAQYSYYFIRWILHQILCKDVYCLQYISAIKALRYGVSKFFIKCCRVGHDVWPDLYRTLTTSLISFLIFHLCVVNVWPNGFFACMALWLLLQVITSPLNDRFLLNVACHHYLSLAIAE